MKSHLTTRNALAALAVGASLLIVGCNRESVKSSTGEYTAPSSDMSTPATTPPPPPASSPSTLPADSSSGVVAPGSSSSIDSSSSPASSSSSSSSSSQLSPSVSSDRGGAKTQNP